MEWDLAVFPQPVSKAIAFNQLLDTLRAMHEDMCARNANLELQVFAGSLFDTPLDSIKEVESIKEVDSIREVDSINQVESIKEVSSEPKAAVPPLPKEGARSELTRVDGFRLRAPRGPHTPRLLDNYGVDLKKSVDALVKQQEQLNEQITKMFQQEEKRVDRPIKSGYARSTFAAPASGTPEPAVKRPILGALDRMGIVERPGGLVDRSGSAERLTRGGISIVNKADVVQFSDDANDPKTDQDYTSEDHFGNRGSLDSFVEQAKERKSRFAISPIASREYAKGTHRWSMAEHLVKSRPSMRTIVESTFFTVVSSLLILSYAGLIAVETSMIANNPDVTSHEIKIIHYVYTVIFAGELMMRISAYGFTAFRGEDGLWNKLDMFFVLSAIAEVIMENIVGSGSQMGSVVRAVRIGRIIRTIRLVRTFHEFHEFQKMAYALLSSMKTLVCSMGILIFVMFFFAVWLTQSAANTESRRNIEDLELRYGNLLSTTYTLFLSVSNGMSWDAAYMPLYRLNRWSAQTFVLYISITMFGVLNVVTSIFVEGVIRSMQRSKDLIVQEKEEEKKIAISHVKAVFGQLDSDGSGEISMDELEHFLSDPSLRKYMGALDIEAEDTRLLFRLLDRDNSGVISVDEFCDGCLRLKGNAKSIDVHALIYKISAFLDKWDEFTCYVDDSFAQIRRRLPRESVAKEAKDRDAKQAGKLTNNNRQGG